MAALSTTINLGGIFPPIPTPFDDDESIAFERLGENLQRWGEEPLSGYVVGGSNGEFISLSPAERLEVLRFVRKELPIGTTIIAGSGLHSTRETIQQTEAMAEAGADAALVITPAYYIARMDGKALITHYQQVADHSPIPVVLYNVPANTGINMTADTVVALSHHNNIVGLKDSAGEVAKLSEILGHASEGFQVLAGSASFLLGALAVGAVGAIAALANFAAGPMEEMMEAFHGGELDRARLIQARLVRPNSMVTSRFGVAGLKYGLDLMGYNGGLPRRPLLPLNDGEKQELKQTLLEAQLLPTG